MDFWELKNFSKDTAEKQRVSEFRTSRTNFRRLLHKKSSYDKS